METDLIGVEGLGAAAEGEGAGAGEADVEEGTSGDADEGG